MVELSLGRDIRRGRAVRCVCDHDGNPEGEVCLPTCWAYFLFHELCVATGARRAPGCQARGLRKSGRALAQVCDVPARCAPHLSFDLRPNRPVATGQETEPGGFGKLCTYGNDNDKEQVMLAPTSICSVRDYGKYGVPGGAVCEGAKDLAQCPRPWE